MKRTAKHIGLVVIFLLLATYIKVYFHARSEFQRAETLLKKGQLQDAVRHYGYVVRWYTPGSRYVGVAVRRMWRLGVGARKQGKVSLSLYAFRQLRSALYAIGSLYQPYASWMERCNKMIADLLAALPPSNQINEDFDRKGFRQEILSMLRHDPAPHPFLALAAGLSFLLWLGGGALSLWWWVVREASHGKRWTAWGITGATFLIWLLALYFA